MNNRTKRRVVCCPSMTDAKLEERLVLSAATPLPAPAPFFIRREHRQPNSREDRRTTSARPHTDV